MRIGIDARSLQNDSQQRGIGTYTRSLVEALLEIDKENQYVLFVYRNVPVPVFISRLAQGQVVIKKLDYKRRHFFWTAEQLLLPIVVSKEKLDIYHSPEYMVPVLARCKKVITVHDFIYRDFPAYKKRLTLKQKILFYLRDNKTLKHADRIITNSYYTKSKVKELMGISEERIKVTHLWADAAFRPINRSQLFEEIRKRHNLRKEFLLYVGAIDYHKNIEGLIKAFYRLKDSDVDLVLAGAKSQKKYLYCLERLITQLNLKDRVHILGYVGQEELVVLYNMSVAVILVSFDEGFGLPVLEAMSCARPVIVSNNASLAEIVDSSGLLVNPYDIDDIAGKISQVLSDEKLRNTLAQRGYNRSKQFNWRESAEKTLAVYREVFEN